MCIDIIFMAGQPTYGVTEAENILRLYDTAHDFLGDRCSKISGTSGIVQTKLRELQHEYNVLRGIDIGGHDEEKGIKLALANLAPEYLNDMMETSVVIEHYDKDKPKSFPNVIQQELKLEQYKIFMIDCNLSDIINKSLRVPQVAINFCDSIATYWDQSNTKKSKYYKLSSDHVVTTYGPFKVVMSNEFIKVVYMSQTQELELVLPASFLKMRVFKPSVGNLCTCLKYCKRVIGDNIASMLFTVNDIPEKGAFVTFMNNIAMEHREMLLFCIKQSGDDSQIYAVHDYNKNNADKCFLITCDRLCYAKCKVRRVPSILATNNQQQKIEVFYSLNQSDVIGKLIADIQREQQIKAPTLDALFNDNKDQSMMLDIVEIVNKYHKTQTTENLFDSMNIGGLITICLDFFEVLDAMLDTEYQSKLPFTSAWLNISYVRKNIDGRIWSDMPDELRDFMRNLAEPNNDETLVVTMNVIRNLVSHRFGQNIEPDASLQAAYMNAFRAMYNMCNTGEVGTLFLDTKDIKLGWVDALSMLHSELSKLYEYIDACKAVLQPQQTRSFRALHDSLQPDVAMYTYVRSIQEQVQRNNLPVDPSKIDDIKTLLKDILENLRARNKLAELFSNDTSLSILGYSLKEYADIDEFIKTMLENKDDIASHKDGALENTSLYGTMQAVLRRMSRSSRSSIKKSQMCSDIIMKNANRVASTLESLKRHVESAIDFYNNSVQQQQKLDYPRVAADHVPRSVVQVSVVPAPVPSGLVDMFWNAVRKLNIENTIFQSVSQSVSVPLNSMKTIIKRIADNINQRVSLFGGLGVEHIIARGGAVQRPSQRPSQRPGTVSLNVVQRPTISKTDGQKNGRTRLPPLVSPPVLPPIFVFKNGVYETLVQCFEANCHQGSIEDELYYDMKAHVIRASDLVERIFSQFYRLVTQGAAQFMIIKKELINHLLQSLLYDELKPNDDMATHDAKNMYLINCSLWESVNMIANKMIMNEGELDISKLQTLLMNPIDGYTWMYMELVRQYLESELDCDGVLDMDKWSPPQLDQLYLINHFKTTTPKLRPNPILKGGRPKPKTPSRSYYQMDPQRHMMLVRLNFKRLLDRRRQLRDGGLFFGAADKRRTPTFFK